MTFTKENTVRFTKENTVIFTKEGTVRSQVPPLARYSSLIWRSEMKAVCLSL